MNAVSIVVLLTSLMHKDKGYYEISNLNKLHNKIVVAYGLVLAH